MTHPVFFGSSGSFRRFAAFAALAALTALPAAGQSRNFTIADALGVASVSDPQLSPDAEQVAYVVSRIDLEENASSSRIHVVPFAGGASRPLTRPGRSASHPRYSPDGTRLAFLAAGEGDRTRIWILPLAGGEARELSSLPGGASSFVWAPDGSSLAVVSMEPDPDAGKDDAQPRPLVIDRLQFKRDGRGYLDDRRQRIWLVDAGTGAHRQLTHGPWDARSPAFSPDSSEVAFVSVRPEGGGDPDATDNSDIFVVPVEADAETEPVRLTSNPGPDRSPVFSPDGNWLLHTGNRKPELIWYAGERLFAMDRNTDEITVVAAELDRNLGSPRFGGDSDRVFALLEDEGNRHLATFDIAEDAAPNRIVAGERTLRQFSVRGARAAFTAATPDRPAELFAWDGTGEPRRLTGHNDGLLAEVRLGEVERITFAELGRNIDPGLRHEAARLPARQALPDDPVDPRRPRLPVLHRVPEHLAGLRGERLRRGRREPARLLGAGRGLLRTPSGRIGETSTTRT